MKTIFSFLWIWNILFPCYCHSEAIDTTFNSGIGTNGIVNAISKQHDGKIYLGGNFTNYNNNPINNLARLHGNGELDTTFKTKGEPAGTIKSIVLQKDGKIVIGGDIHSYNGLPTNRIARLNNDGSVDTSFNSKLVNAKPVSNINIFAVDKLLIGNEIFLLLNSDGSIDKNFKPFHAIYMSLMTFAVKNDSIIFAGLNRWNWQGDYSQYLLKLNTNGSYDSDSFRDPVNSMAIQRNNKILGSGNYFSLGNNQYDRLLRLNASGGLDNSFANTSNGTNGKIRLILELRNGKILLAGDFTKYNYVDAKGVCLLNADGIIDTNFVNKEIIYGSVRSIAVQDEGKVLFEGYFTLADDTNISSIVRISIDENFHISQSAEICDGENYEWHGELYNNTGKFYDTIPISNGKDSIYELDLTVKSYNVIVFNAENYIYTNLLADFFQWVDCANNYLPISGAYNSSYTVSKSGNYGLIVFSEECNDTSDCVFVNLTSHIEVYVENLVKVYPNPLTTGIVLLTQENSRLATYEIINSQGCIIKKGSY